MASFRLNEGLRVLEERCFDFSEIKRLVLPASVESVGDFAFDACESLEYVDFRAAHGLKSIGQCSFFGCIALK